MRKKILVRGPVLSRSGYGEQARFAIRSLRANEEKYDIYINPTRWGSLSWTWEDTDERRWMDEMITKTISYEQQCAQSGITSGAHKYDLSLQVTIPNEWDNVTAAYNVGYTAGIEVDRVSAVWIQQAIKMDKIIVVSNHAKDIFHDTKYTQRDEQGNFVASLGVDPDNPKHPAIEAVNYPVKETGSVKFDHKFKTKFNFLTVAQWGPRKNLEATIGWFVETFKDNEDVGLVVKTAIGNTSTIDRTYTTERLQNLLNSDRLKGRKCKVYLIHGDMSEEEMNGLYQHNSIKAFINLAHGEGFGLPMFEAAYHKVPVVAMGWSGQVDFLYGPDKTKGKSKKRNKENVPYFAKVNHKLGEVRQDSLWEGVIEQGSLWAYPVEKSYKAVLQDLYENYKDYKKTAVDLDKHIRTKFTNENQYKMFSDAVYNIQEDEFDVEDWLGSLGEEVFE
jgi:glycosyltransferase involved in cell wall biosynthesis